MMRSKIRAMMPRLLVLFTLLTCIGILGQPASAQWRHHRRRVVVTRRVWRHHHWMTVRRVFWR